MKRPTPKRIDEDGVGGGFETAFSAFRAQISWIRAYILVISNVSALKQDGPGHSLRRSVSALKQGGPGHSLACSLTRLVDRAVDRPSRAFDSQRLRITWAKVRVEPREIRGRRSLQVARGGKRPGRMSEPRSSSMKRRMSRARQTRCPSAQGLSAVTSRRRRATGCRAPRYRECAEAAVRPFRCGSSWAP